MSGGGPSRVLLINPHSRGNVGDSALVEATISGVRRSGPTASVDVATRYREDASWLRDLGASAVAPLVDFPPPGSAPRLLRAAGFGVSLAASLAVARTPWRKARGRWEHLLAADRVLSCAGGYLFSRGGPQLSLRHVLAEIECAASLRPTTLLPQSIGPFTRQADRRRVRRALRDVERIYVRDGNSQRVVLSEIGLDQGRVSRAPDLVFALARPAPPRPSDGKRRVAITVLDWRWAGGSDAQFRAYLAAMAETAQGLIDRGVEVELVVQVDLPGHAGQDDRGCAELVARRIRSEVPIHAAGSTPEQALDRYSGYDLVIGSRLHSALLALCAGVPAVAIGYQPKTAGIYADIGLSDWAFDARALDASAVGTLADELLGDTAAAERAQRVAAGARDRIADLFEEVLIGPDASPGAGNAARRQRGVEP